MDIHIRRIFTLFYNSRSMDKRCHITFKMTINGMFKNKIISVRNNKTYPPHVNLWDE